MRLLTATIATLLLFLSACTTKPGPKGGYKPAQKVRLAQGWTDAQAEEFWYTPQGSMLIPYSWFLKLEQAKNQTLFRDDANMDRLRFIPWGKSPRNPDALPIGFTKGNERGHDDEMLGLTCAACHTQVIEYTDGSGQVKHLQIEGGASMADFQTFVTELQAVVDATLAQQDKFERFAEAVAGASSGPKADDLRNQLTAFAGDFGRRNARNKPDHEPGYARVDALGNILNEVLVTDLGVASNQRPPNAPVSYPVIWDAHRQDFVQWNGSAPNADPGPLLRNIGEVLGVFGRMKFAPRKNHLANYPDNSVHVDNLKSLEGLLESLQSPTWPGDLPPIDQAKANLGKNIYANTCNGCHPVVDRTAKTMINVHMVPVKTVGTDPDVAVGFFTRVADTGPLEGTPIFLNLRETFAKTSPAALVLRNAVFGVQMGDGGIGLSPHITPIEGDLRTAAANVRSDLELKVQEQRSAIEGLLKPPPQLASPMYKARPLNGIWSSAPYLHNGSVPTLRDMLRKAEERPKEFYVGSRKYDPVNIGFQSTSSERGVNFYRFDTSVAGNSNAGHPFGTDLSDDQKLQLIEYLKTL
jgi:hypothetical protein